jgi:hypothetical protein
MPEIAPSFDDAAGYERLMGAASRAVGSVFLYGAVPHALRALTAVKASLAVK